MVWQDFLLACAAYPEEEPLRGRARGRGPRARRPADAAPVPGALERRQREPLGLRRTGAGRSELDGRTWGCGYYRRAAPAASSPSSTPPARTPTGSPCSPGHALDRGAPERPRPRHPPRVGGLEPRRLHAPTATTSRGSARSSASRARRPGPPCSARSATPTARSRPRTTRPSCCTRRPTTATASSTAAWRRTSACPTTSPTGTGPPSSTRPGRSPHAHHALPLVVAAHRRRDRLAAQRLLAGHVVGRGRRRRAAQAAVVRAAGGVRRPPAHRAARGPGRPATRCVVAVVNDTDQPLGRDAASCAGSASTARVLADGGRRRSPSRRGRCTWSRCRPTLRGARRPGIARCWSPSLGGAAARCTPGSRTSTSRSTRPRSTSSVAAEPGRLPGRRHGASPRQGRHPARRPDRPGRRRRRRARDPAGRRVRHLPRAHRGRRRRGRARAATGAALRQRRRRAGRGTTVGA